MRRMSLVVWYRLSRLYSKDHAVAGALEQYEVRAFLGTVGITGRWVKSFAEITRPLSRLAGKVGWKWKQAEQLSFESLKSTYDKVGYTAIVSN